MRIFKILFICIYSTFHLNYTSRNNHASAHYCHLVVEEKFSIASHYFFLCQVLLHLKVTLELPLDEAHGNNRGLCLFKSSQRLTTYYFVVLCF